jgi:hypothetical protein
VDAARDEVVVSAPVAAQDEVVVSAPVAARDEVVVSAPVAARDAADAQGAEVVAKPAVGAAPNAVEVQDEGGVQDVEVAIRRPRRRQGIPRRRLRRHRHAVDAFAQTLHSGVSSSRPCP